MIAGGLDNACSVRMGGAAADAPPSLDNERVLAMVRLPVSVSGLIALGQAFDEHLCRRAGLRGTLRQAGQWIVLERDEDVAGGG